MDDSAEHEAPRDVVLRFLDSMAEGDFDTTLSLIDDDITYENVSLPTIQGRERFARGVSTFNRYRLGFDVIVHRSAENGSSVLTERTDALTLGRFRMQFWVCGVFEVDEGKITLWRDYFDWRSTFLATLRGLAGVIIPAARARF
jgi:limonene-1,2-epoxide hydrolase